jgi:hypothetical protein
MAGVGIQKKGTGKAVRFGLGGAASIVGSAYQGKPGTYQTQYYSQSLFPSETNIATQQTASQQSSKQEDKQKDGQKE